MILICLTFCVDLFINKTFNQKKIKCLSLYFIEPWVVYFAKS